MTPRVIGAYSMRTLVPIQKKLHGYWLESYDKYQVVELNQFNSRDFFSKAYIQNNWLKNSHSTYRVDLFASRLKESILSLDTVRYSSNKFLRIFQKESTLYGNGYNEREEGGPYSFAQLVYKISHTLQHWRLYKEVGEPHFRLWKSRQPMGTNIQVPPRQLYLQYPSSAPPPPPPPPPKTANVFKKIIKLKMGFGNQNKKIFFKILKKYF